MTCPFVSVFQRNARRLAGDDSGATAIEYGLIVALIALAIIGAVNTMGQSINNVLFGQIVAALTSMAK
jgi:pilus assembly protein Flp/PilA